MIKIKGGKRYYPKKSSVVVCEDHGVTALWGDLDEIQRLAGEEGIDTTSDLECLLSTKRRGS